MPLHEFLLLFDVLFGLALVIIFFYDWFLAQIPWPFVVAVAGMGGARIYLAQESFLQGALVALGLGFLGFLLRWVFSRFKGKDALGLGDVLLLGALGFWVPFTRVGIFLVLCGIFGFIIAKIYHKIGQTRVLPEGFFPLGCALVLAACCVVFTRQCFV